MHLQTQGCLLMSAQRRNDEHVQAGGSRPAGFRHIKESLVEAEQTALDAEDKKVVPHASSV